MRDLPKSRLQADEAIVLRVIPVGEDDGIVTLLTEMHGKVRASVKRLRSTRSGFAGRFELLTRLSVRYDPGRDLARVSEAHIIAPSFAVAADPALAPFCHYIAELSDEMLADRDPSPHTYRLIAKAVEALAGGVAARQVARYVEYWLVRLAGLVPDEKACALCRASLAAQRRADPARIVGIGRDGLVCARCAGTSAGTLERLDAGVLDAIRSIRRRDLMSFGIEPLAEPLLRQMALFSRTLLREALSKEPKTAGYLRRYHLDFL